MRVALADAQGTILKRRAVPTAAEDGPEAVIQHMVQAISAMAAEGKGAVRVGVGAPGPIDHRTGTILQPPHLPGWVAVPLLSILESRLGLPVRLGNDANLAALGEHRFGAGRGIDNFIYITVSTGIGGGIISGGRLLLGERGLAGEVGHIVVERDGPLCSCGQRGCLEAVASGTAIARQAREVIASGGGTMMVELSQGQEVTAEIVAAAARAGDGAAEEIMADASRALGAGIVSLLHLFNPRRIIIGGGVANAWELLVKPVQERLPGLVMAKGFAEGVDIVPAALGDDAGLMGAIALWL